MDKLPNESQYEFVMRTHSVHFGRRRKDLAKLSGVSLDTLNKIFQQQTKNPKAKTVQKIYDVLFELEQQGKRTVDISTSVTLGPVLI
jgi:predicted transcriptional regulator